MIGHLSDEQLLNRYYNESYPALDAHLNACAECRSRLVTLAEMLDAVRETPVPARGPDYERVVWTRILPKLPPARPARFFSRWWMLAPALAAALAVVFFVGLWTGRTHPSTPDRSRERVLLLALSEHLEHSQIILTELVHRSPGDSLDGERARVRDLLDENRLLREAALRDGDPLDASLLDELERVLLDVANSPREDSAAALESVQQRIESQGLLWKVRISSSDARAKGQKL